MHNSIKELIIYLIIFALGFGCCYYYINQRTNNLPEPQNQIEYELKQEPKDEQKIRDIKPKVLVQELENFQDMDKMFYTYLENCEPLNIKTENGYIEYIIEGVINDKCLFKHRQIGFMDTICNVPMEVAKKYSEEGMDMVVQLEELKAKKRTGFVDASQYINDINNDKTYCRHEYYQPKNRK